MAQDKNKTAHFTTLVLLLTNVVCYGMVGWGCYTHELGLVVPGLLLWIDLAMEAHYARIVRGVAK
jgi:hypothetical protein